MPNYIYKCSNRYCKTHDVFNGEQELNAPISDRDNQRCNICGEALERKIAFTGLAWSPTRNGGYS